MRKLEIDQAVSMDNGIQFFSKCHKGYVAVATVDHLGNIQTQWTKVKKYEEENNRHEMIDIKQFAKILLCILPGIVMYSILLSWAIVKKPMLGIRMIVISIPIIMLTGIAMQSYLERKAGKNTFKKFHAAEHMVINAYIKLQRVPSLEEIRQYSRFSKNCGTNLVTILVLFCIVMVFWTFTSSTFQRLCVTIYGPMVIWVLQTCGCLNFLQVFTTSVPTDKELKVAIAGMSKWLEYEKKENLKF